MSKSISAKAKTPDAALAAAIARDIVGRAPVSVRRFTTGMAHYVFDVAFADRSPIVVRIGGASAQTVAGALYLSGLLRPRGMPLPKILASDVQAEFPWMAMERLPGADLGEVIASLSPPQLNAIAREVARAQGIVAQTGSAGRYGYAIKPDEAPHPAWSCVLQDNLSRSQARLTSAQLFDAGLIDIVRGKLAASRGQIDAIAATPFLHDTTTKNVIIAPDGKFAGIVDVDDLCFGDARYPAALTWTVLMVYGGPIDYVSAWMREARHSNDSIFQLYVAVFLLDLMGEHGHEFNGNERPSTLRLRAALQRALEETLARIG